MLADTEVCHHALVELTSKEAFAASNDLALGLAISGAACDVVDGRLVEPHPDDDGSIESGVGLAGGGRPDLSLCVSNSQFSH